MSNPPVTHTRLHLPGIAPSARRPVRMVARNLAASETLAAHRHGWGQVTYALEGVIRVTAADSSWIVPPLRAIWIPPDVIHEVVTLEMAKLRAIYVHAGAAPFTEEQCQVIDVSALLRELIVALELTDGNSPREALLSALLLDELGNATTLPIRIALPNDKRLRALCRLLIDTPSAFATLEEGARRVGASERTLARLFEQELGMSFGQWRRQMRLAHAAAMITRGVPMSRVAAELGYASQSAFSAMFKKTFGHAPSKFFTKKQH
ncbi:helix-turn-helix transcriptional regulator [Janthinobacterium sp. 17J80-10]|uniref:AraC family transcriptional regulator n=1 Tax=Janthinobacterium sp. 17J80-10 TaxID=2497863 RepID=UPI0010052C29|nr:helix-turn-helix transcriptional regulator [Janthinobacterium sp. 17J80-10]QAU35015.1 AraC family transcriptional regulator [Janthinobacterium sp. 17J80-10]